jgi:hypothetical protein
MSEALHMYERRTRTLVKTEKMCKWEREGKRAKARENI